MKFGRLGLAIGILIIGRGAIAALPDIGNLASYVNRFGNSAFSNDAPAGYTYLDTAIDLVLDNPELSSASPGTLLFAQSPSSLAGGLPQALGRMLAIRYPDGMIALLSGLERISLGFQQSDYPSGAKLAELASTMPGGYSCSLRLFDEAKTAWVNPLLLVQVPRDMTAPRLESLVLRRGKAVLELPLPPKGRLALSQASYSVFIRAAEPVKATFSSGVFRYRMLLDGQVVLDRKMDSALAAGNGLAFAGLLPPSSSSADGNGRVSLGSLDLSRGQHLLEISVLDFFGNQTQAAWRLSVE